MRYAIFFVMGMVVGLYFRDTLTDLIFYIRLIYTRYGASPNIEG